MAQKMSSRSRRFIGDAGEEGNRKAHAHEVPFVRRFLRALIGGDDFDLARQQFEAIKTPPLPVAILIRHALKSFGLD